MGASSNRTMIPNTYPNSDKRVFYFFNPAQYSEFLSIPDSLNVGLSSTKLKPRDGCTFGPD